MSDVPFEIENVNKHYLDKVMDLADEMEVEATEDIFDARGMKLIAKGAKISRGLQEKLILHKLKKPLESSIAVEGGVNPNTILNEAQRIAETVEPVTCILRTTGSVGVGPVDMMADIKLGGSMAMMLTIIEKGGNSALEHCVMVGLLAACLANRMGLSEKDQRIVALAGLLHDIGELYIEPEYLKPDRRLQSHEWKHVVVHPRIGQMLIGELEDCAPEVAIAVAEHHERFNGSGYPRQLGGKQISIAGQALAVAEAISSVFMKRDRPLARAALALKIVPGEHPHSLVSAVSLALQAANGNANTADGVSGEEPGKMALSLSERITTVLDNGSLALDTSLASMQKARSLLSNTLERVRNIQRAFVGTGLDICLGQGMSFFEGSTQLMFEAVVGAKEIQWRLQDIARDLALHAASLESAEYEALQPFITLLEEE